MTTLQPWRHAISLENANAIPPVRSLPIGSQLPKTSQSTLEAPSQNGEHCVIFNGQLHTVSHLDLEQISVRRKYNQAVANLPTETVEYLENYKKRLLNNLPAENILPTVRKLLEQTPKNTPDHRKYQLLFFYLEYDIELQMNIPIPFSFEYQDGLPSIVGADLAYGIDHPEVVIALVDPTSTPDPVFMEICARARGEVKVMHRPDYAAPVQE